MVIMNLKLLLEERKMSQAELSRLTQIRPNTVNDLYHNLAVRVSFDQLERICMALDCRLQDVILRVSRQTKENMTKVPKR